MGTQKGRLFELARMYHTYQKQNAQLKRPSNDKKAVEVKGGHFDEEKSISLSYNIDMYPEVLHDSHQRQAQASQMSFFDRNTSEAFYVEPFGAEETVDVPYSEAREADGDAALDSIAIGGTSASEDIEDMKADVEKMNEMEEKLDAVFESDDEANAMEVIESDTANESKGERDKAEAHPVARYIVPDKPKAEVKPYDVSDEEFARDIGAILQGQKVYDANQKKAVSKPGDGLAPVSKGDPKVTGKPSGVQDEMMDPGRNEHRIFEKIAQSMTFANSYDLGSIALNEKFELMDREIEKEEVNKILREKRTGNIDDADVVETDAADTPGHPSPHPETMEKEQFDPNGALNNNNGGRLIKESTLQRGDLILTSSSAAFDDIAEIPGSESIAGIYMGSGKLLTKGGGGVLEEKPLQPHLGNRGVMVALRHQSMSAEKASSIVDALTKLRSGPEKLKAENWLKISCPTVGMHPDVCNLENVDKEKCSAYAGRIYLGTMDNASFMCAESIVDAFEKNKVGFAVLLSKEHNGSLKYLGHLKNKA